MSSPQSIIVPAWWDYSTLDPEILQDAPRLSEPELAQLARPGFEIKLYDILAEFFLAEALEYIGARKESTADNPVGICGPIGPTEQLPVVAQLLNDLDIPLHDAHFWGIDEWFLEGREAPESHSLSFACADKELCFNKIRPDLAIPETNLHFFVVDVSAGENSSSQARCAVMQDGQGEVKHWVFTDAVRLEGEFKDATPAQYRELGTRVVELHPLTLIQNAPTSDGSDIPLVPTHVLTSRPKQVWQADKRSFWHAGHHDNTLGMRLSALMISKNVPDSSVPMSLLANQPNVQFNFFRGGIGSCDTEMH